jgi:hypothetical protein
VIGAPAIAALAHHREQAAGGQHRELLQRLADQRQIRVNLRRPRRGADPGQPSLRQHTAHHAVVNMQLAGNGADGPFLGVVVAQDLHLDVRRRHHGVRSPSGRVQHGREDAGGGAETLAEGAAGSSDRTNGSAEPIQAASQQGMRCRMGSSSRAAAAEHPPAVGVNRDASLFHVGPGSGSSGRHARAGHEGSLDSAGLPLGRSDSAPARRSRGCSRSGPGRSSCR